MTLANSNNKNKKNYTNKYIRRKPGQADDSPSEKKTFEFKSNMPILDIHEYMKRKKLIEKLEKLKGPLAYGKNV